MFIYEENGKIITDGNTDETILLDRCITVEREDAAYNGILWAIDQLRENGCSEGALILEMIINNIENDINF